MRVVHKIMLGKKELKVTTGRDRRSRSRSNARQETTHQNANTRVSKSHLKFDLVDAEESHFYQILKLNEENKD